MTAANIPAGLEASLSHVEQLLSQVSTALIAGEPLELEAASTQLRQAMAHFAALARTPAGAAALGRPLRQRLEKVSQTLTRQRENLLRRAVVVDRELATVLPQAQPPSTYAPVGTYRGGAARIYAKAAS